MARISRRLWRQLPAQFAGLVAPGFIEFFVALGDLILVDHRERPEFGHGGGGGGLRGHHRLQPSAEVARVGHQIERPFPGLVAGLLDRAVDQAADDVLQRVDAELGAGPAHRDRVLANRDGGGIVGFQRAAAFGGQFHRVAVDAQRAVRRDFRIAILTAGANHDDLALHVDRAIAGGEEAVVAAMRPMTGRLAMSGLGVLAPPGAVVGGIAAGGHRRHR